MRSTKSLLFSLGTFAGVPLVCATMSVAADRPTSASPVPFKEAPMEVSTVGQTPAEISQHMATLSGWLQQEAGVVQAAAQVQLTPEQITSIEYPEPVENEPLPAGLVVPVLNSRLRLDGISTPTRGSNTSTKRPGGGTLTPTADGGYLWTAAIKSNGAGAVRVHVEKFSLPINAELYYYSRFGEAYGPYTSAGPDGAGPDGRGEFWTPSVMGSEGILQLRVKGDVAPADLESISLHVTEVGHIGRGVFGLPADAEGGVASFCPTNAACVVNTNCVNQPIVNGAELAAAKMLWVSGAFIYTCTGGLLNDTVAGSQIPYFLTANHCLSKNSPSLEAFFGYQDACGSTSNCTGTWDDPPVGSYTGKTVGATVKATNRRGDFTLLQLSQNPPAGSVFLGWTNAPVANTNNAPLYRVSHPSGAPQSYSDQTVSTSAPTCTGWPRGERVYSRGVTGATEGGSSGSVVVNASGQVVGQLSGSCGTNNSNVCDNVNNATVDGAFAYYYNKVQPFLAP